MEIHTEIKKMTLAHEIGAGASCLKCKDKCEGFELHFWRKICRNCKCSLEDHDVQMESAENKKVGKLFADTKYTGLIDKLKTGGPYAADKSHQVRSQSTAFKIQLGAPQRGVAQQGAIQQGAAQRDVGQQGAGQQDVRQQGAGQQQYVGQRGAGQQQYVGQQGAGQQQYVGQQGAGQQGVRQQGAGQQQYVGQQGAGQQQNVAQQGAGQQQDVGQQGAGRQGAALQQTAKMATLDRMPPVKNTHLVMAYIELLPPEKRPIAGTAGAEYHKRQMARQLPEHDQDPSCCHDLSPGEVKVMQQYVKKCKTEALGVGDLKLPEEMAAVAQLEGGETGCPGADTKASKGPEGGPEKGSRGTIFKIEPAGGQKNAGSAPPRSYLCNQCNQPMKEGEPAVYADRAGYEKLWHPACFVCCTCTELLVDMIYFWKKDKLYCGRHYGESEKPRCGGCDELIFSNEYTQAEGQNWHLKHFCCFDCDCVLAGQTYVMEDIHPVCETCYMRNHAVKCVACELPIQPEAQRVSYGESHWHAEPGCFQCATCSKCLIGQRFMVVNGKLFCSVECKKAHQ